MHTIFLLDKKKNVNKSQLCFKKVKKLIIQVGESSKFTLHNKIKKKNVSISYKWNKFKK